MDIKLFYLYRIANMIPMYTVDIFLRYLSWCGVILDGRVHFLNFSIIAKSVYFFDIHSIIRHLFRLSTE